MDAAEELYEALKVYVTNHRKWLDFLKEIDEGDPRGVYNTSSLDDRLFLLNEQIKVVQGQCKATKDNIVALDKSMPTEAQVEMETERLKSLTSQRDEMKAELKEVFTKIQQRDMLLATKAAMNDQLEIVQKEYEAEQFPEVQIPDQGESIYKDLCDRLDAFKKLLE